MDAMATPLLLLLLPCLAVPVMSTDGGKARSCAEVRQFYSGKGFTLQGVPQSEISGETALGTGVGLTRRTDIGYRQTDSGAC